MSIQKDIKIGYQGEKYSNNHRASIELARKAGIDHYTLVPLTTSKNVVNSLKRNEIDYGVVASKNSIGGIVEETYEATQNESLEFVATVILPISHCAFIKDSAVANENITRIISHEQALRQCANTLKRTFPNAVPEAVIDTSIAARYIAEGKYDNHTAAICTLEAGEAFDLHLVRENVQDDINNRTELRMYRINYDSVHPSTSWLRKIAYLFLTKEIFDFLIKTAIVAIVFLAFSTKDKFGLSSYDAATYVSTILASVFLFLTSKKFKAWLHFRSITGYWKYTAISDENAIDTVQRYNIPRLVYIQNRNDELLVTGWIADRSATAFFQSKHALISSIGERSGNFVYWYETVDKNAGGYPVTGVVTLAWALNHPADKIYTMHGKYNGDTTRDTGNLTYIRITKEEFDRIKASDFL